jgi:hypothetical protein
MTAFEGFASMRFLSRHVNRPTRLCTLLLILCTLCVLPCHAEELEPRRWAHLPIDTNFFGAGYAYTKADISFDPVLKIEDAKANIDTWAAKYIRTFSLFDKSARVDFLQGYQEGHWKGLLDGEPKSVRRKGWADSVIRFAINLYGAPPLKGRDFALYRAETEVETIIGAGLAVQLPTGEYMDDKLINLGTNRFTLRPQLGLVHTRGKWSTEITGLVELYSDNNDFFNGRKLEQDPLYLIHAHLVYAFRPGLWSSASAGYDYGGRTTIDGERKDDRKQDLGWALSFGFPITRQMGAKLVYIGTRSQESTGADSNSIIMSVSLNW